MSDEPDYPRAWLEWYLTPLLPENWRIIPSFTTPERITQVTVNLTHTEIAKQPAAPQSDNLVNDVVIRLTHTSEKLETAENELDPAVLDLVYALKHSERVNWVGAKKAKDPDSPYLSWDITVQVLSSYTPPVTP